MSGATATPQEVVLQASNFTVEISPIGEIEHVKSISGGAIKVDTQTVTGGTDKEVMNASGRPVCDLLTIEMLLTKKNSELIKNMAKFMSDTQNYKRTTITYTKLDRNLQPTGKKKVWAECFMTSLTHPQCNNVGGPLTITTIWQANSCSLV